MDMAFFSFDQIKNISTYSMSVEFICFGVALVMLFFMLYTRPKMTNRFMLILSGTIASIVEIALMVYLVKISEEIEFQRLSASICILVWLILMIDNFIFQAIYNYIVLFGNNMRDNYKNIIAFSYALQIIYFVVAIALFRQDELIKIEDHHLIIVNFINFIAATGLFYVTLCIVTTVYNRANIAKFVSTNIYIFGPLDFILLIGQIISKGSIFLSAAYIMPLIVFYMMFHSNPIDAVTGCQNIEAFDARIKHLLKGKREYVFAYISYPELLNIVEDKKTFNVEATIGRGCRYISDKITHTRIYRIDETKFAVIKILSKKDVKKQLKEFKKTLEYLVDVSTNMYDEITYCKLIVFKNDESFKKELDVREMFLYLKRNYTSQLNKTEEIFATPIMYKGYQLERKILSTFEDIRSNKNYNDDRILCYAQPIYNVSLDSFKTAEALIRLSIDGVMVPPQKFIGLAEERGYIHSLTMCMITKVCQSIKNTLDQYDFDAITVNVSAIEFSEKKFYKDILGVIDSFKLPYNKIRIEITESAIFDNYEIMRENITRLREAGIEFYLDDYGTGYSNLDRMTSDEFGTIKFDKSIFYKANANKDTDEMLSAIIKLVKKRGITTLVEGVETDEQSEYAKDKGFEYIQGFRYARPVPIEQLVDFFEQK